MMRWNRTLPPQRPGRVALAVSVVAAAAPCASADPAAVKDHTPIRPGEHARGIVRGAEPWKALRAKAGRLRGTIVTPSKPTIRSTPRRSVSLTPAVK